MSDMGGVLTFDRISKGEYLLLRGNSKGGVLIFDGLSESKPPPPPTVNSERSLIYNSSLCVIKHFS